MIARGAVVRAHGGYVEACLPAVRIGDGVTIETTPSPARGYVCAVETARVLIAVRAPLDGIARGTPVRIDSGAGRLALGTCALGRAIDARGRALDGGPAPLGKRVTVPAASPAAQDRKPIHVPFWTGLRVLDGLLTFGRGARVGVFGAPGAGKSTLLEAIERGCRADAVVVALVGERGREAQRWICARDLRTTVVCATSDRPAAERVAAAEVAMAQAAALRARGLHVLLVLDSLARLVNAWRELAVAAGETAGRGGYPPSVFAGLAGFVEIAGALHSGSVTLIASVLDDGDDRDPVSDAARSLLDGHIALSSRLAQSGRFPAVDVLASASRTMAAVAAGDHLRDARAVRNALALLERIDDARRLGIEPGDPASQRAIAAEAQLDDFVLQDREDSAPLATLAALHRIAEYLA